MHKRIIELAKDLTESSMTHLGDTEALEMAKSLFIYGWRIEDKSIIEKVEQAKKLTASILPIDIRQRIEALLDEIGSMSR